MIAIFPLPNGKSYLIYYKYIFQEHKAIGIGTYELYCGIKTSYSICATERKRERE